MMAESLDAENIPEYEGETAELKKVILDALSKRLSEYDTSLEEDEALLMTELNTRRRMAVEVRLAEKRILRKATERVTNWVTASPTKRVKV